MFSQALDVDQMVNLMEISLKRFKNTTNWLNATLTQTLDFKVENGIDSCDEWKS